MRGRQEVRDHVAHVFDVVERKLMPIASLESNRLMRSWLRSMNSHRLDPGRWNVPRVLSAVEVRERCDRLDTFTRIARQGVDRLYQQVSVANYCVLLTDATGVTVDFRTVPALDREFKDEGFRLGTCWSELEEGTCGVGTSIMDGTPTLVHKTEHFRAHNVAFTCSAAPIFGLNDELLAILDASALHSPDSRESQALVFKMVVDAGQLIEDAFAFDCLRPHWILQMSRTPEFLDVRTEYLLAFDDSGRLVGGNRKARHDLLTCRGQAIIHIEQLFDCSANEILAAAHGRPGLAMPLRVLATGERFFAVLRAPTARKRASVSRTVLSDAETDEIYSGKVRGFSRLASISTLPK